MRRWILFGITVFSFTISRALKPSEKLVKRLAPPPGINFRFTPKSIKFSEAINQAAVKFPELQGITIDIKRKQIGTMMAARPKPGFLFRKKTKRKYVIYITDKPGMNADSMYSKMSDDALVGVLGHELSHILDYNSKNNWQLLGFIIKYPFTIKNIEAETDRIAFSRGFGEELVEYTRYIHKSPHVNRKYLLKKKRFYLSASELETNFFENAVKL